jgi:hypothetical protein
MSDRPQFHSYPVKQRGVNHDSFPGSGVERRDAYTQLNDACPREQRGSRPVSSRHSAVTRRSHVTDFASLPAKRIAPRGLKQETLNA